MTFKNGDTCPCCGVGKIVTKSGRYGDFFACDMYRHTGCNFAKRIDSAEQESSLEKQADQILAENGIEVIKI